MLAAQSARAFRALVCGLVALATVAQHARAQCYKADQQVNVRSQASICSGAKGSINTGDIIKVSGQPQQECYNWGQGTVETGGLDGTQGYFNLDAFSPTSCPNPPPPPPNNSPCKNTGQGCNQNSDCCQAGSGPAVQCQGNPKTCSGGAVVTSATQG